MVLGDDDNQFAAFRALLGIMGNLSVRIDRVVLGRLVDAAAAHEQQGEICAFRLAVLLQICTKLGLEDHPRFYTMMHLVASEVPKWPAQPTKPLVDTLNHLMLPLVCQYRSDGDGQELYDLKERLLGAVVEYLAQSGVGPSRLDTYCQINLCVIELHIRLERPLLWCALSQKARDFLAVVSQVGGGRPAGVESRHVWSASRQQSGRCPADHVLTAALGGVPGALRSGSVAYSGGSATTAVHDRCGHFQLEEAT
ncbi:hypothetical protein FOZ63_014226 [Perkinsus olseni]|uniref:Uncharacterized protein n=1 Tax=Perkinsus olseni TaxID=32597 RepID=A0A7J6TD26_PEROL|nr:hypothetical protein FOZ63_014226 [Perkinsus olseni]